MRDEELFAAQPHVAPRVSHEVFCQQRSCASQCRFIPQPPASLEPRVSQGFYREMSPDDVIARRGERACERAGVRANACACECVRACVFAIT